MDEKEGHQHGDEERNSRSPRQQPEHEKERASDLGKNGQTEANRASQSQNTGELRFELGKTGKLSPSVREKHGAPSHETKQQETDGGASVMIAGAENKTDQIFHGWV